MIVFVRSRFVRDVHAWLLERFECCLVLYLDLLVLLLWQVADLMLRYLVRVVMWAPKPTVQQRRVPSPAEQGSRAHLKTDANVQIGCLCWHLSETLIRKEPQIRL